MVPVCKPFLDGKEIEYVTDAVSSGWISSSGSYVSAFEDKFSDYCGMKYGIAVTNGTVALHLALVALGIGKGDEVIIPSFTMIATAFAVCYTGAMPVFVDADKNTWNIDVSRIEEKITSRTKAIIPVHIFGNPCDMDSIMELAKRFHLYIVEDAAESHGAEYHGRKVGSFSHISCFSFFANKNITTGEGGMCVTDSEMLRDQCKYYKNMCFPVNGPRNYHHEDIGFNYRMSNIHAAIGLAQTEKADYYKSCRIKNAELYRRFLSECPGVSFQTVPDGSVCVSWMNAIVIDQGEFGHSKEELVEHLKLNEIETRLLFKSMSNQAALVKYGCNCRGEYPVTDWLSENGLYLPSASDLTEGEIKNICSIICNFARS